MNRLNAVLMCSLFLVSSAVFAENPAVDKQCEAAEAEWMLASEELDDLSAQMPAIE